MKRSRKKWSQTELDLLAKIYPSNSNAYVSEMLHRSPRAVMQTAWRIGVHKNPDFADAQLRKNQFGKGHVPHNKGKGWRYYVSEKGQSNSLRTCFKKGEFRDDNPQQRPIGFEMLRKKDKYGRRYWWIKPEDGRRMMPKHRYIWEKAFGPIPKGHCVQFKDGDTTNCELDNLYLISRAKQVRKNFDGLPEERKAQARAKIHLTRNKSIRADRLRLKWGLEPLGKLIKRRPL